MKKKHIYTFDEGKNKDVYVGYIIGDRFVRDVDPKIHFMVTLNSYALQDDVIKRLKKSKIKIVKMREKRRIYTAKLKVWLKHSLIKNYKHGKQYFLDIVFMKEIKRKRRKR